MIDHRIRIRGIAAASAALAVVLALAGCGQGEHTPPQQSTTTAAAPTPAAPAGVDDRDPDQVLTWVAAQVFSWRPGEDLSAAAGFDRARPLLTSTYIAQVGPSAEGLANVTGGTWTRWTADKAVITATARVSDDDHPADTSTTRQRVVVITQRIADAAAAEPDRTVIAYMIATLQPGTDRWRVSMISPR